MSSTLEIPKVQLPSAKFKKRMTNSVILLFCIIGISIYFEFDYLLLFTDFHYLVALAQEMSPPNISLLVNQSEILLSIGQTIAMAFLGTLIGGTLALILAFLAAENTTPHFLVGKTIKMLLAVERVIPSLVIILIFLIVVGLGPFAGMLSIAIGSLGMFGKLFADAIERTDKPPIEALDASGIHQLQVIRFGIIPQVLPSFIGNLFYAFDINLRAAIALGVFGGGGIGYEIHMAMQMLRYQDALALILFTIILISLFEKISDALRKRIIGGEGLK